MSANPTLPRAVLAAALLAAGTPLRAAAPAEPALDLASARIVDLTHAFDDATLYWPNAPSSFKLTSLAHGPTPRGFFYAANSFCAPEHGGTHLDAPIHFAEAGWTAEQIPAERFVRPGVVIDARAQAAKDPDHRLTLEAVKEWEQRNGPVPEGAIVLLRTGWSSRWPDRQRYFGDDTPGDTSKLHFPSYGVEAAHYLVTARRVAALGVDTPSIDYGPSQDFNVHQIAAGANVLGLENLTALEELPERGAWIVALPMKIAGGSGGPARVIGLVPR
jgi:kynurenine formamidase